MNLYFTTPCTSEISSSANGAVSFSIQSGATALSASVWTIISPVACFNPVENACFFGAIPVSVFSIFISFRFSNFSLYELTISAVLSVERSSIIIISVRFLG